MSALSQQQVDQFRELGYVKLDGVLAFPGCVARSRTALHLELLDADQWHKNREEARHWMARIDPGWKIEVAFRPLRRRPPRLRLR